MEIHTDSSREPAKLSFALASHGERRFFPPSKERGRGGGGAGVMSIWTSGFSYEKLEWEEKAFCLWRGPEEACP